MKTIVIYTSQTGFTKRYAEWISEASGAWRGAGVVPKAGFGCSELCERKTKTER